MTEVLGEEDDQSRGPVYERRVQCYYRTAPCVAEAVVEQALRRFNRISSRAKRLKFHSCVVY